MRNKVLEALKKIDECRYKKEEKVSLDKFEYLTKAIKQWMNAWPAQSSALDVLRASGLYFVCPREFVLNYWQPLENRSFDWTSSIRMSLGTYLHSYLQNYVLGPMGVLYGKWIPLFEDVGEVTEGFHPDPNSVIKEIQEQKTLSWFYRELNVWDKELRIAGHVDGFVSSKKINWILKNEKLFKKNPIEACNRLQLVKVAEDDLCLLEIKTTGQYQFSRLNSIKDIPDYYKMQACIYQQLFGIKETVFWFIERDTFESKVFVYTFEKGWWKDAERKANIIWKAVRNEELPEVGMACKLPTDRRAKKCVFCRFCFSKDFDFDEYVVNGKEKAKEEGRKLLTFE